MTVTNYLYNRKKLLKQYKSLKIVNNEQEYLKLYNYVQIISIKNIFLNL